MEGRSCSRSPGLGWARFIWVALLLKSQDSLLSCAYDQVRSARLPLAHKSLRQLERQQSGMERTFHDSKTGRKAPAPQCSPAPGTRPRIHCSKSFSSFHYWRAQPPFLRERAGKSLSSLPLPDLSLVTKGARKMQECDREDVLGSLWYCCVCSLLSFGVTWHVKARGAAEAPTSPSQAAPHLLASPSLSRRGCGQPPPSSA